MRELGDLSSQRGVSDRFGKRRLRQDATGTFPRHWRVQSRASHFSDRDQGLTLAALGEIPWVCS